MLSYELYIRDLPTKKIFAYSIHEPFVYLVSLVFYRAALDTMMSASNYNSLYRRICILVFYLSFLYIIYVTMAFFRRSDRGDDLP